MLCVRRGYDYVQSIPVFWLAEYKLASSGVPLRTTELYRLPDGDQAIAFAERDNCLTAVVKESHHFFYRLWLLSFSSAS